MNLKPQPAPGQSDDDAKLALKNALAGTLVLRSGSLYGAAPTICGRDKDGPLVAYPYATTIAPVCAAYFTPAQLPAFWHLVLNNVTFVNGYTRGALVDDFYFPWDADTSCVSDFRITGAVLYGGVTPRDLTGLVDAAIGEITIYLPGTGLNMFTDLVGNGHPWPLDSVRTATDPDQPRTGACFTVDSIDVTPTST